MENSVEMCYTKGGVDEHMDRLRPLNDFIFGKTFGEKGDEEQLLSLLNAILAKTKRQKLVTIEI